jgi:NAD(P)-dependent dehydrogenase (short-subunit alcohol dehydrogenase family)
MGTLDGKGIVVTGASRGLGEAMALGFAREGARLALAARTVEDLERVATACEEAGGSRPLVVPTDIADEEQVQALVGKATAELGKIDVFVANAGISYGELTDKHYRDITTYDRDVVDGVFKVNVTGTWLCLKAALPAMGEGGSVIVVGSETGRALYPGAGMYAITKSALDALATLASREQAARGIRVNVLSPGGMVDTRLFGPKGMPEFLKQAYPPLPADVIVPAAVWLASEASAGVTGGLISGKDFNARGAEEIKAGIAAAAPPAHHHG